MHGLQQKLGEKVDFISLSLRSEPGSTIATEYGVRFAGTHVLLGRNGDELYRNKMKTLPDADRVCELIEVDLSSGEPR